jgi:hypothetical protein
MSYAPPGVSMFEQLAPLSPWSDGSIGPTINAICSTAMASTANPSANLAFLFPITISSPFVVKRGSFMGGAATSGGNGDCGIYRASTLARVASTGAFARVIAGWAHAAITPTLLVPDDYYLAFSLSTTNSLHGIGLTGGAGVWASCGVCEMATAHPLPSTATLTLTTRTFIPLFALNGTTVDL